MSSKRILASGGEALENSDERKKSQIPIRTSAALRDALVARAKEGDRSLTQEIEQRLERSIAADEVRGGVHNVRLLDAIAAEIATVESMTGKQWNADQVTFQLMLLSIPTLLKRHAPMIENGPEVVALLDKAGVSRARHINAFNAMKRDKLLPDKGTLSEQLAMIGRVSTSNQFDTILSYSDRDSENKLAALVPDDRKVEFHQKFDELVSLANERYACEDALAAAYAPQKRAIEQAAQMFSAIRDAQGASGVEDLL